MEASEGTFGLFELSSDGTVLYSRAGQDGAMTDRTRFFQRGRRVREQGRSRRIISDVFWEVQGRLTVSASTANTGKCQYTQRSP